MASASNLSREPRPSFCKVNQSSSCSREGGMLWMQHIIRTAVLSKCLTICESMLADRYKQLNPASTDNCISPLIIQEYHIRLLIFDSGMGQNYAFFSDVGRRWSKQCSPHLRWNFSGIRFQEGIHIILGMRPVLPASRKGRHITVSQFSVSVM